MHNNSNKSAERKEPYTPFVSVVVPAYNTESMMELCIKSLLSQTYPKDRYEIIIIDNNSTDDTASIIKKYPVIYLSETEIQSPYAARNKGIKHAKGEIIAFTDSDCVADKDWISNAIVAFEDPAVVAVGGPIRGYQPTNYIELYQEKHRVDNQKITLSAERVQQNSAAIATGNAFYRACVLEKVGYFDCTIFGGGDFDLSYRIQDQVDGIFVYVADAVIYHKHAMSLKKLWEQYSRYGYGNIQSEADTRQMLILYDEIQKYGTVKVVLWRLRRNNVFSNSKIFVREFFLSLLGRNKPDHRTRMLDAFLETVEQLAFLRGELKSLRKNKNELARLYTSNNKPQ